MTDHYIVVTVAGVSYGLPSHQVAHIELVENVTRVPNAPRCVDGVVFSRGAVVPALNLRARFGFDPIPYDTKTRLVVIQHQGRSVGLVVDSAREFVAIPPDAIQPPNDALTGLSGRYLLGVATLGERLIFILAVSEVLNVDELALAGAPGPSVET